MGDRTSLRSLLQQCNDVHRKDIYDVTSGHLNENKLPIRSSVNATSGVGTFWSSAKKEPIWLRKKVVLTDHKSLSQDSRKKQLPPIQNRRLDVDDFLCSRDRPKSKMTSASGFAGSLRSGKEHVFFPETMLPLADEKGGLSNQFVPNHSLFATKREQYEHFKETGEKLLKKKTDTESMSSDQHADHIQRISDQMNQKLKLLSGARDCILPNYQILKAYSEAWEELISTLPPHQAQQQSNIKQEYDTYVKALLEEHMIPHEYDQLEKMIGEQGCGILDSEQASLSRLIQLEEERLKILEDDLISELKENDKLRIQVRQSKGGVDNIAKTDATESRVNMVGVNESEPTFRCPQPNDDLEQQVLHLHAQIEEAYEEMSRLKRIQREEYVPRAVCTRLEQCLKETEIDCQKLVKQNDFLEQNIEEMEDELASVMVETGSKIVKRLWHRVSVNRVLNW